MALKVLMTPVDVTPDNENAEESEIAALPVSPPMLALFVQYHRARTQKEREDVCFRIAEQFAAEYDPTAQDATEDWHDFFEAHAKASLALEQAALKLSRLAVHYVTGEMERHGVTLDEVVDVVDQHARTTN